MDQLTLRWYGHACFTVTCREFTVAFDPYEDNYVPGFAPLHLQADLVLCSHQHTIITLQVWSNRLLAIRIRFIS